MVEIFIIFIFIVFISAVLAIQIQESVLALRVKKWLGFTQPYNKSLKALGRFGTWKRMMGTASFVLLPLVLFVIAVLRFHAFLADLLDCTYCSSFHITWILLYFAAGFPLVASLITAPLGILAVYIVERIKA